MQTFELERNDQQVPFLGPQQNSGGGGGIGELITKYRLFGGQTSDDDRNRRYSLSSPTKEILNSPLFQKSLLGLIALAVMIHLVSGVGSTTETTTPIEITQLSATPQQEENLIEYPPTYPSTNTNGGGHHTHPPMGVSHANQESTHGHANQQAQHEDIVIGPSSSNEGDHPTHPTMGESHADHESTHGHANQQAQNEDIIIESPASSEEGGEVHAGNVPPAHSFSLGGFNNKGHNTVEKNSIPPILPPTEEEEDAEEKEEEEEEAMETEIMHDAHEMSGQWDISTENVLNEAGHYLHDPLLSPFASSLYVADDKELNQRQEEFQAKMKQTKEQYGQWNPPPSKQHDNLNPLDFSFFAFRDVDFEHLHRHANKDNNKTDLDCWQRDAEYITGFLGEAQALVEATKEAIMEEYGASNAEGDERFPFDIIIDNYEVLNGTAVHTGTLEKLPGVAYLPQNSWDGLVRKLLHAMITEDYFYVVVAGRADTYDSNNLAHSQVMQFNYIMEPLLHKLGVTLVSRNMGMDASPLVAALGGADLYGETDILWHVQDAQDEEAHGAFDLLHRQAILSGERVPLVLSSNTDELTLASKGKAWVGNLQPGEDWCEGKSGSVAACQDLVCRDEENDDCSEFYRSTCWEKRSDWNPDSQNDEVGTTSTTASSKRNPGYRHHQIEGRKMTLLLLHALNAALDLWRQKLEKSKNNLPLAPSLWHVGDAYTKIRRSIWTRRNGEALGLSASCELLVKDLVPEICHLPMHAYTEWTPRVIQEQSGLLAVVNNKADILASTDDVPQAYVGPDIVPLWWQIPKDEVDVHMVAIATNTTNYVQVVELALEEEDGNYGHMRRRLLSDSTKEDWQRIQPFKPHRESNKENGRRAHSLRSSPSSHRALEIYDGSGWRVEDAPVGFCDGSAQSFCNRTNDSPCLLANHNHYKGSLVGSSQTGWVTFRMVGVKHGIILARLDLDGEVPDDFVLDYAINQKVKSVPKDKLDTFGVHLVEGLTVYPLLLDEDWDPMRSAEEMTYHVGIRIRGDDTSYEARLSHLYFS